MIQENDGNDAAADDADVDYDDDDDDDDGDEDDDNDDECVITGEAIDVF